LRLRAVAAGEEGAFVRDIGGALVGADAGRPASAVRQHRNGKRTGTSVSGFGEIAGAAGQAPSLSPNCEY
jgi:hypothetical protein